MRVSIPGQDRVIAHYGEEAQSMIHMEECGELIQAVSKMRRAKAAYIRQMKLSLRNCVRSATSAISS